MPNNRVVWVVIDHIDQLLRSIGSISANIAEGYGFGYKQEFIHSLRISRKENSESLNWLYKCKSQKLITDKRFKKYELISEEIRLMLNSLISKLVNKSS